MDKRVRATKKTREALFQILQQLDELAENGLKFNLLGISSNKNLCGLFAPIVAEALTGQRTQFEGNCVDALNSMRTVYLQSRGKKITKDVLLTWSDIESMIHTTNFVTNQELEDWSMLENTTSVTDNSTEKEKEKMKTELAVVNGKNAIHDMSIFARSNKAAAVLLIGGHYFVVYKQQSSAAAAAAAPAAAPAAAKPTPAPTGGDNRSEIESEKKSEKKSKREAEAETEAETEAEAMAEEEAEAEGGGGGQQQQQ